MDNLVPFDCGPEREALIRRTSDDVKPQLRNRVFCVLETDIWISKKLIAGEYWEEWMVNIFRRFYVPGTDAIDIGAHVGTSTLLMDEVVSPGNKIYAFEPVFHRLVEGTIVCNDLMDRVNLFRCGAGDRSRMQHTTIKEWTKETNFGASSIDREVGNSPTYDYLGDVWVDIAIVRIDDLALPQRVSLIKIDVEGMELEVLRGMQELVLRDRPTILIEVWSHAMDAFMASPEFVWFQTQGYKFLRISEGDSDYIFIPSEL